MRHCFLIGCVLGMLSVGLGAFGAHILKNSIGEYGMALWERATYYQMVHAIMIVMTVVVSIVTKTKTRSFNITVGLFMFGILCFSGSLYTIALTGIKGFGIIAPVGGFSFMFGWIFLAIGFYRSTISTRLYRRIL